MEQCRSIGGNRMINKKAQEKCLDIVNEFNSNVDIASEDIINLLKSECETYGELLKAIDLLKKGVIWNRLLKESDIDVNLFEKCKKKIIKEMNDLKIIIHS